MLKKQILFTLNLRRIGKVLPFFKNKIVILPR